MSKLLLTGLIALAAGALAADAAHARSFTVKPGRFEVKQLGPLNTNSTRTYAPTIGAVEPRGASVPSAVP